MHARPLRDPDVHRLRRERHRTDATAADPTARIARPARPASPATTASRGSVPAVCAPPPSAWTGHERRGNRRGLRRPRVRAAPPPRRAGQTGLPEPGMHQRRVRRPTCKDGGKNGSETDVDCGGACFARCPAPLCRGHGLHHGGAANGRVRRTHLRRREKNSAETGVDAADPPAKCPTDLGCASDGLPERRVQDRQAPGPSCTDGEERRGDGRGLRRRLQPVRPQRSAGPTPTAAPPSAALGRAPRPDASTRRRTAARPTWTAAANCPKCDADGLRERLRLRERALRERCAAATCTDSVKNGNETDVDCGGGGCPPCANGKSCRAGDCKAGSARRRCAGADVLGRTRNGDETDIDCGASAGSASPERRARSRAMSGPALQQLRCQTPTCSDRPKNGNETDKDCGGSCSPCAKGKACVAGADCGSKAAAAAPPRRRRHQNQ